MYERIKHIITSAAFLLVLFGFGVLGIVQPDQAVSEAERRPLAQLPSFSGENVLSGKVMADFGKYAVDQFPFRDQFRSLKALTQYKIYGQKDNNGVYIAGDMVGKLEYPLKEESVIRFAERISRVYEMYLKDNEKVFYTVVPDKNYFLAQRNGLPAMDYETQLELIQQNMPIGMQYIDILGTLSIDKYYRTDTHWRSEELRDTVERIAKRMGFHDRMKYEHESKILTNTFYGVYCGQAAIPLKADTLTYIENEAIRAAVVTDYDKNITGGVYYADYQKELDAYAYFLNGSSSLITIDNSLAKTDKELILFRDSFGSAIAPWLIEGYKKITVIDIRYIMPETLGKMLSFDNADVLFLYSTLVINNSETIK